MGIDLDKDWFVVIYARDEAYLNETQPHELPGGWDYHSHRNADINSYHLAIQYILDQGGFVIRTGYKVKNKLDFIHPRVIDYANLYRNDFMDIFLPAHCKFLLGAAGGASDLAVVFNKPRLSVNWQIGGTAPFGKNNLYLPKKARDQKNGEYVPLGKLLIEGKDANHPFAHTNRIKELGYTLEDNTPEEILDVTKEMFQRLDGNWNPSEKEKQLQQRYRDLFPPDHFYDSIKTPVGSKFLLKYEYLL